MVKIASAAAGAVVFAAAATALPVINTPPSITQCTPASLQWSNAEGTVRIFILPGGQVSAAPIKSLPDQTGASGSYVWNVDVASGTNITIAISDGTGTTNYASPLVVLPSSNSACLNGAASSSASVSSSSSASASSSSASATSSRASSSSAAASSSSSSAAASSSSRASSSTSQSMTSTGSAPAQTSSRAPNAAAAFSPATAGLSVIALAGALLPFL
ncbi:uncharacterized protein UTRI_01413 [Ustilago trichophora]|uniref:Uncharacterized protein n=1 Tax=Ustilago trichophora TaxID=86804 RepID=A0A5C3DWT0_9BASI|nr:uncharacterized protein UTRI_01413 [Ustilago trichophora]